MKIFEVTNLTKHFGGLCSLNNVSFNVNQGDILGIIGPNGAGKSTLLNVVSGVYKPTSGQIIFKDKDISGLHPYTIAKKGIIRTYQANVLFKDLTVIENVIVGHHLQARTGFLKVIFTKSGNKDLERIRNDAIEILEFCGLADKQNEMANNLPHRSQRILAIAIALGAKPKLLLLDEPVTGMNVEEASHAVELLRRLRSEGVTIVIIEHDMDVVMNLCERIVVLNFGEKIAEGTPGEIMANEKVIDTYLGREKWEKCLSLS